MRHCSRKKTTITTIIQCKLQYYVQPPLPPLPPPPPPQHKLQCMHSVYAPLLKEKDHHCHHTVQVTILRPTTISYHHCHHHRHHYNACIQYMHHCCRGKTDHQCKLLWAWPSTSTLQTTACAKEYMRKMVEDKDHQSKLQRVKKYTATIGVHDAANICKLA